MSSERRPVQIPITTTADTRGVQEVQGAFAGFLNSLKLGFGIDLARLMMQLPTRIARAFRGAVRTGIDFNATMEQSRIAIAAMLQTSQPERFKTFHDALSEGARLTALLDTKTKGLATTYLDLVEMFKVMTPYMAGAGVVDLRKQIDLIAKFDQLGRMTGMDRTKMMMELRGMFTGQLQGARQMLPTFLGGIQAEELRGWMQSGQLYDQLIARLDKTNEAASETGGTLRGMWDIFTDVYAQTAGLATAGIFENLKNSLESLNELLSDEEIRRNLRMTGDVTGEVIRSLSDATMQFGGLFGARWIQQLRAATTLYTTAGGFAQGMLTGGRAGGMRGAVAGMFRRRGDAGGDMDEGPILPDVAQPDPFDVEGARAAFTRTMTLIQFQYDHKLIALDDYLRERQALLQWAAGQEEAIFDGHAFDKMRLDLDLEGLKLRFGEQMKDAGFGLTIQSPTGSAARGIYTAEGEAQAMARQVTLQTRMVDLLEGIRSELRSKLPVAEAWS